MLSSAEQKGSDVPTTDSWLIWDLDGCLVDNRHRVHHVKKYPEPDWESYVAEAPKDRPYKDALALLHALNASGHFRMAVVTARIEDEGENTKAWLAQHGLLSIFEELHFRTAGDFRRAPEIKLEIVKGRFIDRGRKVVAVFEDHPGTVSVLRTAGITALHVREYF